MNPTPTGGRATPSPDGDEPDETADPAAAGPGPAVVPAPRSGLPLLPRRRRSAEGAPLHLPADPPHAEGRDPDGRPYGTADAETLNRLLTGLQDI